MTIEIRMTITHPLLEPMVNIILLILIIQYNTLILLLYQTSWPWPLKSWSEWLSPTLSSNQWSIWCFRPGPPIYHVGHVRVLHLTQVNYSLHLAQMEDLLSKNSLFSSTLHSFAGLKLSSSQLRLKQSTKTLQTKKSTKTLQVERCAGCARPCQASGRECVQLFLWSGLSILATQLLLFLLLLFNPSSFQFVPNHSNSPNLCVFCWLFKLGLLCLDQTWYWQVCLLCSNMYLVGQQMPIEHTTGYAASIGIDQGSQGGIWDLE